MRKIAYLIATLITAGAMAAPAVVATPAEDETAAPVISRDSLLLAGAAARFNDYRSLGEVTELNAREYYAAAAVAADAALAAIDSVTPGSQAFFGIKEILRELEPQMEAGAFYSSSVGDNAGLNSFSRRFIDIRILPAFKGEYLPYDEGAYPIIAYNASCDAYNSKDYERAIEYFKVYFSTGDATHREKVYAFMGQAAMNAGNYDLAVHTLRDGVKQYPSNERMRDLALKACVDGKHGEYVEELVTGGLELYPDKPKYIELLGCLMEDNLNFLGALDQFRKLDAMEPERLSTAKHIALDYYNAAVDLFNRAQTTAKGEKEASRMRRQARNYFAAAAQKLEEVLASDPTNVKYLRALGVSFLCMEQKERFMEVNSRLQAMGQDPLQDMFMPPMMAFGDTGKKHFPIGGVAESSVEAPPYSDYGSKYVTERLSKWATKGEFETMEAYSARMNPDAVAKEYERLSKEAADEYIKAYSANLRLSDVKLMPYDVLSQAFRVDTNFGPFFLNVPNHDNEAEMFKAGWEATQLLNTRFCIVDDKVNIASLTVLSPNGKRYEYSNSRTIDYTLPTLNVDVGAIMAAANIVPRLNEGVADAGRSNAPVITALSDVDTDIPVNKPETTNKLALIIANENYESVAKVDAAYHDGKRFADYCVKTLGIPEHNVVFVGNASLGKLRSEIHLLEQRVKSYGEPVDVIFYYAGHGMPDETTKDAYMLPVDGNPLLASETGYSLQSLYSRLADMDARSVVCFIDACFSGARRDGGMLASARAVVIEPKAASAKGNMFILTAASGQEAAMPYLEKNHGMFTYYLLKKLQESRGNATLSEIADYVTANVKRQSSFVNNKPQTPTLQLSGLMGDQYRHKKLKGK